MEFTTSLELQSQTTRLVESILFSYRELDGAVTLHGASFQKTWFSFPGSTTSTDYNSEDFQSELFPLHSQLLRESWLVSFPPLSYMLKFSGYSYLTGGLMFIMREDILLNRWIEVTN